MVTVICEGITQPLKNEVCQNVLINKDVQYVLNKVKNRRGDKVVELCSMAPVV